MTKTTGTNGKNGTNGSSPKLPTEIAASPKSSSKQAIAADAKQVLVTGATGFLGRHLVFELGRRGYRVRALVRTAHSVPAGAEAAMGDVLDKKSLAEAMKGIGGVFHLAGLVSRKTEDAGKLQELHVVGTKNVLESAKAAGVTRVVVASTSGTVGISEDPDHIATEDESAPIGIIQRFPYYRSKLFAEQAALAANDDGFEVISVNPSLLLGPGDVNGSSTEDVRLFLEGKVVATPPGGISFVDVRDAALAMTLAYEKGRGGRRYLVGACNITLKEYFARLSRIAGVRAPLVTLPRAPEATRFGAALVEKALGRFGLRLPLDSVTIDMATLYWYIDSTRAEEELGWKPRDPNETLHETVSDLRDRGVVWPELFERTAP